MRLSTAFSFAALGAAAVSALPNQQIALDWVAGTLSQIGDDSPHTATVWSWYDCGEWLPPLSMSPARSCGSREGGMGTEDGGTDVLEG